MKEFLLAYALWVVLFSAWFAWKSIRRMTKIGRGIIRSSDLSLDEKLHQMESLRYHPAFADTSSLAYQMASNARPIHPILRNTKQWMLRWLIYFPMGILTNFIQPLNWIYALIPAILLWLQIRS